MLKLTNKDINAVQKAAAKNGWHCVDLSILEDRNNGTLRNGVAVCDKGNNEYCTHNWSINESGVVGLHNGSYFRDSKIGNGLTHSAYTKASQEATKRRVNFTNK